jgi:L-lactate dehydrogenase complex protein LldG
MNVSPAKENILKKIRQALSHSTPLPFPAAENNSPVFPASSQELEIEFAEQFTRLQGKFIYCMNLTELAGQLASLLAHQGWTGVYCQEPALRSLLAEHHFTHFTDLSLADCEAALTSCELLIARTGSIVLSTANPSGRTASVYAPVHLCIAYTSQLVYDIREGLQLLKEKWGGNLPSLVTLATGPSRTADIEKTLVVGVHGPKEVYVFLVDQAPGASDSA